MRDIDTDDAGIALSFESFELFALDVRNYSIAALPAPFAITSPAQSITGRPYQAEAFYARDPVAPDWRDFGAAMRPVKKI